MSDHRTEADIVRAGFGCGQDLAEVVFDSVGISGGVKKFDSGKSLILVGLPGLEPGTRPL